MKRIEFIMWAGKQGWKHGQTYLNKAWDLFSKSGNIPKPTQILNKAKDLYKNFKTFDPKVVKHKAITDKIYSKPQTVTLTPFQLARWKKVWSGKPTPKPTGPGKVIPFPKKPPGKADGGRIDKPLPTRSRDI